MNRTPIPRQSKKRLAEIAAGTYKPKPKKALKRTALKKKRRVTGELAFFLGLYELNKHSWVSQISGADLVHPEFDDGKLTNGRAFVSQFSHILNKLTYPDLRLVEENIVFKTGEEHRQWEDEKWTLVDKLQWGWVFEREAAMKRGLYGL